MGGTASSKTAQLLFDKLAGAGVFVAAAMGNEYEDGNPVEYLGAYKGVHAVCAVDELGLRAAFSDTGRQAIVSAPGTNIVSTMPSSIGSLPYGVVDGASTATPRVAAAAAGSAPSASRPLASTGRRLLDQPCASACRICPMTAA